MENQNTKTFGIISVVCAGIAWFIYGLILSVVAIIFGALSFKTTTGKIGLILGIVEFFIMLSLF